MKPLPIEGYTALYFTTASIKGWKHLLKPDKYKRIVTDSMAYLADRQEVWFYAFVIMPNHIHWIWDRAVHWQQVGDTAAALRLGFVEKIEKICRGGTVLVKRYTLRTLTLSSSHSLTF